MCSAQLVLYSDVKWECFIEMRAACFAPSFLQKRGALEWGWLQAWSSHFNEKFSFYQYTIVNPVKNYQNWWITNSLLYPYTFMKVFACSVLEKESNGKKQSNASISSELSLLCPSQKEEKLTLDTNSKICTKMYPVIRSWIRQRFRTRCRLLMPLSWSWHWPRRASPTIPAGWSRWGCCSGHWGATKKKSLLNFGQEGGPSTSFIPRAPLVGFLEPQNLIWVVRVWWIHWRVHGCQFGVLLYVRVPESVNQIRARFGTRGVATSVHPTHKTKQNRLLQTTYVLSTLSLMLLSLRGAKGSQNPIFGTAKTSVFPTKHNQGCTDSTVN